MIQKINYFFTKAFDVILYPFSFIHEFWGIFFLSVLMSFVVLYLYKWVSSPKAIKDAKDMIKADILAIRLYKDLWKVILGSFFKSLFHTFKYFGLNFLPIIFILPILFPAFVQMDIRYGMEPYKVGDEVIVTAKFNSDIDDLNIKLLENEHFVPKMNPVFIKVLNEVNWKLKAVKAGTTEIRIQAQDNIYEKRVMIGDALAALSNKKMRQSSIDHFINPAEKLLPANGDLNAITVHYPGKEISFAGLTTHWLIFNLILVVIVVLALKNRFGIEF